MFSRHICVRETSTTVYLLGRSFTLYNDHQALVTILKNPKAKVPLRIERLTLRLQGYNFDIKHIKSEHNISDYASRHPQIMIANNYQLNDYVSLVTKYACPNAISIEDIKEKTRVDKTLQHLARLIKTGNWYQLNNPDKYPTYKNADIQSLKRFARFRNELTVANRN